MSELLRITIAPIVKRLKFYIETAQENLSKDLTEQIKTDLLAERQNLCRAVSLLEKNNDKWEAVFHRVKGPALQDEEQNYINFLPEGKPFMEWADQARGFVETIDGALGLSEQGDVIPQNQQQPVQVVQPQVVATHRHDVTLPPISLPKFSGEPREWPLFWKLFEASVESLQIEDFKKHIYLLGCLPERSVVRRAIDLYPPSDENYPRVVEILKKRFGDEKQMVESLQAELLHLPKPSDSVQSLRIFSEAVERICQQLSDYGENEQNKFMASTIKSKLPFILLTQVVEKEMASSGTFDCSDLRKAITSIVEVKEEVQRCTQVFRGEEKPKNFPSQSQGNHFQRRGNNFRPNHFRNGPWRPNMRNENLGQTPPQVNRSFQAIDQTLLQPPQNLRGNLNRTCSLCDAEGHPPSRCPRYPTPGARRRRLSDQQRCLNCLTQGHNSQNCNSLKRCFKCGERHHFMVCLSEGGAPTGSTNANSSRGGNAWKKQSPNKRGEHKPSQNHLSTSTEPYQLENFANKISEDEIKSTNVLTSFEAKKSHAFLMTRRVMVKSKRDPRRWIEAPVLFDPGSQTSYISDSLINKLKPYKVTSEEMEVYGFGGERSGPIRFHSPVFSIQIKRTDDKWEEVLLNRTERISTPFKMAEWISKDYTSEEEDVNNALRFSREEPEILISARHFWKYFKGRKEVSPGLFVIQTTLGPLVNGESDFGTEIPSPRLSLMAIGESNHEQLPTFKEVEYFFNLESLGIKEDPNEDDDQTAMQLFNKSIRRESDGRYSVKWPWKEETPSLPSNYRMAFSRLMSTLSRLKHSPELLLQYDTTIQDQLSKGIIEEARKAPGTLEHYIPHQGVLAKGKKLRVVYDASAHTRGTNSLNNCLYRGPVLLPDLIGMLMRFRCPAFPLLLDIQAAFLQISLEPEDREVTKFLWLKDFNKPLTPENLIIYRVCRVSFGVISSPFILAATLQHHLRNYNSDLAKELADSLYVDNALMECETPEEAITKYKEAKAILKEGSFNLREFVTNSKKVMEAIPLEDRLEKAKIKVLGIIWDIDKDEMVFEFPSVDASKLVNKRLVLSFLASLFDPLGLLGPCIQPLKLFFQSLWEEKKGWDDVLSEEDSIRWSAFQESWKDQKIRIPRRTMMGEECSLQLHAFVDASIHTFAAAIYLRVEKPNEIQSWLIFSKNRLKPKNASKALTIPRMELLAILIGVRGLKLIHSQLRRTIDHSHLWSDSQIALNWVASKEAQPKFIERRIKEIRNFNECQFNFVRTAENSADLATRGAKPEELASNLLWWHGPDWLTLNQSHWPNELSFHVKEEDSKEINDNSSSFEEGAVFLAHAQPGLNELTLIEAKRYSSWTKLVRTVLYVLRFLHFKFINGREPSVLIKGNRKEIIKISKNGSFTAEDVLLAEHLLIRLDQMKEPDELKKYPSLIDDEGILRLRTRLGRSDQPFGFTHPVLLGKNSQVRDLIILQCHQKRHHLGVDSTLTEFLNNYWSPQSRTAVKRVIKQCLRCRRMMAYQFALPKMPPLPEERVCRQMPFKSIGIDFLGPTETRLAGEKVKAWIIIVTCLTTRAVYLEAMLDTTAESFLNVLRRFISRRGKPDLIWSDNATSFKLAEKTIGHLTTPELGQNAEEFLALNKIKWKFIAQISPWAGGVYERLVQLCKNCFKRTLGRKILNFDELNTFVAEVEATLNHRPITVVVDGEDGIQSLRPIDLLQADLQINWETNSVEFDPMDKHISTSERLAAIFKSTKEAHECFWVKWHNEYLLLLRERAKWDHKGPHLQDKGEPKKGMIVLISEEFTPRNQWSLGKIIELNGRPGAIRSVQLEVPIHGVKSKRYGTMPRKVILTRPVNKIFPLELGFENPNEKEERKGKNENENPHLTNEEVLVEERVNQNRHGMITRSKTRIMTILNCLSICWIMFALVGAHPTNKCKECKLACSNKGITAKIPKEVRKVELCCAENCYIHENVMKLTYELPKEILLNDYQCYGHFWMDSKRLFKKVILCPAVDECLLIDCYLCMEQLANPTCYPLVSSMLAGGLCLSFLSIAIMAYSILKVLFSGLSMLIWLIIQIIRPITYFAVPTRPSQRGRRPRETASQNWTSRRVLRTTAFIVIFSMSIPPPGGGDTVAVMAKSEKCIKNASSIKCLVENTATLALLPAGQTSTLLLKTEEGVVLGSVKVILKALALECQSFTKAWQRSYELRILTDKRCPKMGSCESNYCGRVHHNTLIPELREANAFPGNSFCLDSTAFWGNKCLLGGSACLFYRWFAKANSKTVYEIIGCNSWEFVVYTTIQLEALEEKLKTDVFLYPGRTLRWNNISVTPIGVTFPPAPVLNSDFVFDGDNVALTREPLTLDFLCKTQKEAQEFNCLLGRKACTDCLPDHSGGSVNCNCRSLNLERLMESPERRLPLNIKNYQFRNIKRRIIALTGFSPVQLHIQIEGLQMALELHQSFCTILPLNLTGCYRCSTGAQFRFVCSTSLGNSLAEVTCDDGTHFSIKCDSNASIYQTILSFDKAKIQTNCQTKCLAGKTSFFLNGTLHYVPYEKFEDYGLRHSERQENYNQSSWLNLNFDWKATIWSLMGFQSILVMLFVFAIGIICLVLFVKVSPLYRLWKLFSWFIIGKDHGKFCAVLYILYLAGGGSFRCVSEARPIPSPKFLMDMSHNLWEEHSSGLNHPITKSPHLSRQKIESYVVHMVHVKKCSKNDIKGSRFCPFVTILSIQIFPDLLQMPFPFGRFPLREINRNRTSSPIPDNENQAVETNRRQDRNLENQENIDPFRLPEEVRPFEMDEIPMENPSNWEEVSEWSTDSSPNSPPESPGRSPWRRERTPSPMGPNWRPPRSIWPLNRCESLNLWFPRVGVHPLLPMVQVYGGYSQAQRSLHIDYFPLEVIDICFYGNEELIVNSIRNRRSQAPSSEGSRRGSPSRIPTVYILFLLCLISPKMVQSVAPVWSGKSFLPIENNFPSTTKNDSHVFCFFESECFSTPFIFTQNQKGYKVRGGCSPSKGKKFDESIRLTKEGQKMEYKFANEALIYTFPISQKMSSSSSLSSSSSSSSPSSQSSSSSEEKEVPLCQRQIANLSVELHDVTAQEGDNPNDSKSEGELSSDELLPPKQASVKDFFHLEAKEEKTPRQKKPPTCSQCRIVGHRSGAKSCPLYQKKEEEHISRKDQFCLNKNKTGQLEMEKGQQIVHAPSPPIERNLKKVLKIAPKKDIRMGSEPPVQSPVVVSSKKPENEEVIGPSQPMEKPKPLASVGTTFQLVEAIRSLHTPLKEIIRNQQRMISILKDSTSPLTGANTVPFDFLKWKRRFHGRRPRSSSSSSSESSSRYRKGKKKHRKQKH